MIRIKCTKTGRIILLFFLIFSIYLGSRTLFFGKPISIETKFNKFPVLSGTGNESLEFNWIQTWGGVGYYTDLFGSRRSDYGHEVAVDSKNDVYLVGETGSYGNGMSDFCLVKYNEEGTQLWNRTWGGSRYDSAMDVAVDSEDNVYIAGSYHYYVAGEPQGGDMAVVKYNSSGDLIWQKTFGGSNDDDCFAIAIDANDNIYLAGARDQQPNNDFLVAKYNKAGTLQWSRVFGGQFPDTCYDVAVDSNGNVYLVGNTNSYGTLGWFNFLIVKYNAYGSRLWYKAWGGSSDDHAYDVEIDSSNNIYVTGHSGDPDQITVVKFSSSGTYLWHRAWSGGSYFKDEWYDAGAIVIDNQDLIYVTGSSKTLRVYNMSGDLQWTLSYASSGIGTCSGLAFDSHGNLYFGGKKQVIYQALCVVKYKVKTPKIDIISPISNNLYGFTPPEFELSIYEPQLNTTWYKLNDGSNYTFSSLSGHIDQEAWDACGNGTVNIRFFANNSDGDTAFKEVIVRKDIIAPTVSIVSPINNALLGNMAPVFEISINEPHLDMTWYSLNNGQNYTVISTSGSIDQDAWDACGNGTVNIKFYANDTLSNVGYHEVIVRKNTHIPEIIITDPYPLNLFGESPPTFNLSIIEPELDWSWYTLNDGQEYFFSGSEGIIDQGLWDLCGNGTVTIRFYANNTVGNFAFEEVHVFKDIIDPEIVILSPDPYELFGNATIGYDITITEPHLNTTWYSLNNGENYTFSDTFGLIDQETWDACWNGTVLIRFYANDTLGHLTVEEVMVRKDIINPIWDTLPQDQNVEFGEGLNYQMDASDPSGIVIWWINNSLEFSISSSGLITNIIVLTVKNYYLEVKAYDPAGNYCKISIKITVQDTTAPTWDVSPTDQFVEFGDDLDYDLDASDLSGIDYWWINDTSIFNISQTGLIFNNFDLSVGNYWIEVRAYDPYNHYCEGILMINVSDTINPSWDEIPIDQFVEFGDDLDYDLDASDLSGIDYWWINDTSIFNISQIGLIFNNFDLSVGNYWIEVRAYDPYNHYCEGILMINVSDTINPIWDEIPTNQHVKFGEDFYYDVNASDLSGIDYWWINDTSNFYIDDQGLITNRGPLSVGNYWIEIRAYDPYGQFCFINIKITVSKVAKSPSIYGYNIIALLGVFCIITLIIMKKFDR